eukprot:Hpha_TRINITY_DN13660_c1_g1::TRINITY_DN13660_c1_g1_i1::g.122479::m.122479
MPVYYRNGWMMEEVDGGDKGKPMRWLHCGGGRLAVSHDCFLSDVTPLKCRGATLMVTVVPPGEKEPPCPEGLRSEVFRGGWKGSCLSAFRSREEGDRCADAIGAQLDAGESVVLCGSSRVWAAYRVLREFFEVAPDAVWKGVEWTMESKAQASDIKAAVFVEAVELRPPDTSDEEDDGSGAAVEEEEVELRPPD